MHLYCHAAKSNQLCKQQRSRCSINSCKIISRHGCVQEPSTLASTAKPVQRYRVEIPFIPHICISCHQWISIIPSWRNENFIYFLSPLMVALARGEWLPPPSWADVGRATSRHHTVSYPVAFPHSHRARLMQHMCSTRAAVLFYSKSYQRMKEGPAQRGVS